MTGTVLFASGDIVGEDVPPIFGTLSVLLFLGSFPLGDFEMKNINREFLEASRTFSSMDFYGIQKFFVHTPFY